MALIEKETIRAEIERRLKYTHDWLRGDEKRHSNQTFFSKNYYKMKGDERTLDALLSFLYTLPEQPEPKPMNIPSAGGGMSTTPPKFKLDVKPEQLIGLDDENAADKKAVKEIVKTVHKEVTRQVKEILARQPVEGQDEAAERYAQFYDQDLSDENGNFVNGCGDLRVAFIAGAEYQRKQDQSLIELAEDHAMLAGMNKMKEQMMEKAVEAEVIAGKEGDKWLVTYVGDYESMLKVCKTGDKVKVIVIPEEK